MAVVVDSVSPADGAVNVFANTPVIVELSDSTDMTLSLIEVLLGSQSFTIANGGLEATGIKKVSGGVYVDDFTDVTVATRIDWYYMSGEEITVVVKYNSSTLSTTSFTVLDHEQHYPATGMIYYTAHEFTRPISSMRAYWICLNNGTDRCTGEAYYWTMDILKAQADLYYYVGHPIRVSQPVSAIVGELVEHVVDASMIVQAYMGQKVPASMVTQNWTSTSQPASVITGVYFRHGHKASVIVGAEVLTKLPASMVVYGVVRGTVVEIIVPDDTTRTVLEGLGVTFG